jgi:DNA-binding transcriptional LysR family regulator
MSLFDQMETFVRIVQAGSLSGAARQLRRSVPGVSRQLHALEQELGVQLVVRSTRRMNLTDAGRHWYETSLRVLRELDEARERIASPGEVRGSLVVSASVSLGLGLIVGCLPAINAAHPHLVIELRLEDRLIDFIGEGVDVAIRAGAPPPDSTAYQAHRLTTFSRRLVAAPAYLERHGTPRTPEQLARHACLVQVAASHVRWMLLRGDEAREVDVQDPIRSTAPLALRDLARAGLGVALLPEWLVEQDLASGTLKAVLKEWSGIPVSAWAVHRVELRSSVSVRAFVEGLAAALRG